MVLPEIISENQNAFVAGRSIVQNILICQDLVRLYNRKATTKSYLIKIDLKKAYDIVEWRFVEEMLYAMNFPEDFRHFHKASGLCTNTGKSNIFSANMEQQSFLDLCELTGYQKGKLPFKYLGVPVSTKKLNSIDSEMLVDRMTARIKTWGSKNLSYAGRVQLINSVLMHVHTYWASIFLLPKAVMKQINTVCRNFLWDGKEVSNRAPLIAWDLVYKPKEVGGLGITNGVLWNEAAIGYGKVVKYWSPEYYTTRNVEKINKRGQRNAKLDMKKMAVRKETEEIGNG
ncbi:uncharacterized protein [Nicotiana tomentosiformis]|uniref:uncharacterized protein n=1 Tax=Nicotiana tomentosiformis TaxID=4098 RepID=UPI00388CD4FF